VANIAAHFLGQRKQVTQANLILGYGSTAALDARRLARRGRRFAAP
jgi:hypothetical protein